MLLPEGKRIGGKLKPDCSDMREVLLQLQEDGFSGYCRISGEDSRGLILLARGRLKGAFYRSRSDLCCFGLAALKKISELCDQCAVCELFQLSLSLLHLVNMAVHGSLRQRVDVDLISPEDLMERVHSIELTGVLHIYSHTEERAVFIFFRTGNPVGFFHDGDEKLTTDADPNLSIVTASGACMDMICFHEWEDDEVVFPRELDAAVAWEQVQQRQPEQGERGISIENMDRTLVVNIRRIAVQHLGEIGVYLVDKELPVVCDNKGQAVVEKYPLFLQAFGPVARTVSGGTAVKAMLNKMENLLNPVSLPESADEEEDLK